MPDSQAHQFVCPGWVRGLAVEIMRLRSVLPVLFEPPTEAVCEEGEDGIGAAQSPERTGLFES
jgi:hypothetical protein